MKPIYPWVFLIVFSACNRPKEKIYLDAQPVSATTSFQGRVWDTGLDTCLPNAKLVFKRHKSVIISRRQTVYGMNTVIRM